MNGNEWQINWNSTHNNHDNFISYIIYFMSHFSTGVVNKVSIFIFFILLTTAEHIYI